jgi:hypothetical protein
MAKGGNVVSEDWKAITGTDWSQAKKLGLTDGSYEANIALHKKLLNGEINLNSISKPSAPALLSRSVTTSPKKDYKGSKKEVEPDVVIRPSSISSQQEKIKSKAAAPHNVPMKVHSDPSITRFLGPTFGASPAYMPLSMGRQPAQPFDEEAYASANMPFNGAIEDKRTNTIYYYNSKTGKKGSVPSMTGKNVNLNSNPYSIEFLEKHPELRNTPVGTYLLETPDIDKPNIKEMTLDGEGPGSYYDYLKKHYNFKLRNMSPVPAYGLPAPTAESLAVHSPYSENTNNPNDPEYLKRVNKLKSANPSVRCGSYGCSNVLNENYDEINTALPTRDTMQVIDSKRPGDLAKLNLMKKRTGQKRDGGQTDDYGIPNEEANRLRAASKINFIQPMYFQSGGPLSDDRYMYEQGGINQYGWGGPSNGPLGYFQEGGEEQETTDDTYNNDFIYQQYMNALQNNNELYDSFNTALLNQGQEQPEETAEDDTELRYGGIDNSNMKPQFATGGITNYGAFSPVMQDGGFKPDKNLVHKMAKEQFGLNTPAPTPVPTITSITDGKKDFFTKYLSGNVAKVMANNVFKEHQDMMNQSMNPYMDPNMGQNMDQGMEQMPQDMQQAYAQFGGNMYEDLGQNQFAYGGGLNRFLPRHQEGSGNTGQYEEEGSPENDAFWNNQVGDISYPQLAPSYTFNPKSTAQQPLNNAYGNFYGQAKYNGLPKHQVNGIVNEQDNGPWETGQGPSSQPFGDPNYRAGDETTPQMDPFAGYDFMADVNKDNQMNQKFGPPYEQQQSPWNKQNAQGKSLNNTGNNPFNMGDNTKSIEEANKATTPKKPSWFKTHAGDIGRGIVAGEEWLNSQMQNRQAKKSERKAIKRGMYSGDRNFVTVPERSSSGGNYGLNGQAEGILRPNQDVPVHYRGYDAGDIDQYNGSYFSSHVKYGGTSHKKNTELYMTEDELEKFLKAGGQVEYLD